MFSSKLAKNDLNETEIKFDSNQFSIDLTSIVFFTYFCGDFFCEAGTGHFTIISKYRSKCLQISSDIFASKMFHLNSDKSVITK